MKNYKISLINKYYFFVDKNYQPSTSAPQVNTKCHSRLAQYLHLRFGFQNLEYVQHIAQLNQVKGTPKDIVRYDINCPFCKMTATTKLTRGRVNDTT